MGPSIYHPPRRQQQSTRVCSAMRTAQGSPVHPYSCSASALSANNGTSNSHASLGRRARVIATAVVAAPLRLLLLRLRLRLLALLPLLGLLSLSFSPLARLPLRPQPRAVGRVPLVRALKARLRAEEGLAAPRADSQAHALVARTRAAAVAHTHQLQALERGFEDHILWILLERRLDLLDGRTVGGAHIGAATQLADARVECYQHGRVFLHVDALLDERLGGTVRPLVAPEHVLRHALALAIPTPE